IEEEKFVGVEVSDVIGVCALSLGIRIADLLQPLHANVCQAQREAGGCPRHKDRWSAPPCRRYPAALPAHWDGMIPVRRVGIALAALQCHIDEVPSIAALLLIVARLPAAPGVEGLLDPDQIAGAAVGALLPNAYTMMFSIPPPH